MSRMSTHCIRILENSQVTQSRKKEEETSQDSLPNMSPMICYQSKENRPSLSDYQQKFLVQTSSHSCSSSPIHKLCLELFKPLSIGDRTMTTKNYEGDVLGVNLVNSFFCEEMQSWLELFAQLRYNILSQ